MAIMHMVRSIFSQFGISVAFIEKTIMIEGDLSDGRSELYSSTFNLIMGSPVIGHGISTYSHYVPGVEYPHNFVLQFLFDGGIILLVIIFAIVVPMFIKSIKNRKADVSGETVLSLLYPGTGNMTDQMTGKLAVVLFLSGVEITRALLSGNIWRLIQFWLLIGIVMNENDLGPGFREPTNFSISISK